MTERETGEEGPEFKETTIACPKCSDQNATKRTWTVGKLTASTIICDECGYEQDNHLDMNDLLSGPN